MSRLASADDYGEVVIAAKDDATGLFLQVTRPGSRTLQWAPTNDAGGRTTVMALPHPTDQQFLEGAFDGRWLVFGVGTGMQDINSSSLYAWDSQTRAAPTQIAETHDGLMATRAPAVHGGRAVWAQGDGVLHIYDLATAKDTTVPGTKARTVFFTGSWLVWLDGDGEAARLRAIDAGTGTPVALPPALTGVTSVQYINGGGDTVVWDQFAGGQAGRVLMGWHAGWDSARPIVSLSTGSIESPTVGGDLVTFGDTKASFVADLRSGSYAQVTPEYGYAWALSGGLIVEYYTGDKSDPARPSLVQAAKLPPLPACR
jgi:hypothetical protein